MAEQQMIPRAVPLDADRCCPAGQCAYRPAEVRRYLDVLRELREAVRMGLTEDVSEAAESALTPKGTSLGRSAPSNPGSCHNAIRLWDVQMAIRSLGGYETPEQLARRLCPWALEEAGDG